MADYLAGRRARRRLVAAVESQPRPRRRRGAVAVQAGRGPGGRGVPDVRC